MNDEARLLGLGLPPTPELRVTLERQPAGWRVAVHHLPTERARVYSFLADLDAVGAAVEAGIRALMPTEDA